MTSNVVSLTRLVMYRRNIELPAGEELSPELLNKVSNALSYEIQTHDMKETSVVSEVEVCQVADKPHGHLLRLDGERVFLTEFGVERELDLGQV